MIPNEAELAEQFGCARATVNRALRGLAEAGYLDRRRKAGTRVALNPVRKATLHIPVIHEEVETKGGHYGYALISRRLALPPLPVRSLLRLAAQDQLLQIRALHLSDGQPYAFEDRWVNPRAVPALLEQDLEQVSANAWLVRNMPYTKGTLSLAAAAADAETARVLGCMTGEPTFTLERTTWMGDQPITWVRLSYPPGHRITTEL